MSKQILNYWQRCSLNTGANKMAYDLGTRRAYCASRQEELSASRMADKLFTSPGRFPDKTGTGSITIDPKPHTIWIASHKDDKHFVPPDTPSN